MSSDIVKVGLLVVGTALATGCVPHDQRVLNDHTKYAQDVTRVIEREYGAVELPVRDKRGDLLSVDQIKDLLASSPYDSLGFVAINLINGKTLASKDQLPLQDMETEFVVRKRTGGFREFARHWVSEINPGEYSTFRATGGEEWINVTRNAEIIHGVQVDIDEKLKNKFRIEDRDQGALVPPALSDRPSLQPDIANLAAVIEGLSPVEQGFAAREAARASEASQGAIRG